VIIIKKIVREKGLKMPKEYSEAVEQTIQGPKEERTNNDLQNTTQYIQNWTTRTPPKPRVNAYVP
jgi:hypothetical protein